MGSILGLNIPKLLKMVLGTRDLPGRIRTCRPSVRVWYRVQCMGHDTSVRQHYKSEHWAPVATLKSEQNNTNCISAVTQSDRIIHDGHQYTSLADDSGFSIVLFYICCCPWCWCSCGIQLYQFLNIIAFSYTFCMSTREIETQVILSSMLLTKPTTNKKLQKKI